ncbi:MAG TPA: DUF5666 domain-containing protein [bacterium]|nr:DUF5666 domain-containing protein [bacterium]
MSQRLPAIPHTTRRPRTGGLRSGSGFGRLAPLLLAALTFGCGGGGSTPQPDNTGTVTGKVTIGAELPTADPRGSTRIIDPGESIAGLPAPRMPDAQGNFVFPKVPVVDRPLYVQVGFTPTIDLGGGGGTPQPVAINVPVRVGQGVTTNAVSTINQYSFMDQPMGVIVGVTYDGPDGARTSRTVVNFRDRTVSHDVNGDGTFDDTWSPDVNLDGLSDDRNRFDDNPGGFQEIERQGRVEVLTNDAITVAGTAFQVNGATNIFNKDTKAPLVLADINVNDLVDVRGFMVGSDLIADRIRLDIDEPDDDPVDPDSEFNEVEREGPLLAKGTNTLRVLDLTFRVNTGTVYRNELTGGTLTFDDLQLGQVIEIEGYRFEEGLIAQRVTLEDEEDPGGFEVEREGRISAITPTSLTVVDLTFEVTGTTLVVDKDTGDPVPYSTLLVNDFVRVEGHMAGDTLTATEIRLDREEEDPGGGQGVPFEREGAITALTADTLTVQGTAITVTAATEFRDDDTGEDITFADLRVGDLVEVEGVQNGTVFTATRVRRDSTP